MDDKYFKFDKINSILMKKSRFNKLIKEKKLNAISYYDYINNQYLKIGTPKLGAPWSATSLSNIQLLGASYMIISLITLGMISGSISSMLSKDYYALYCSGYFIFSGIIILLDLYS